MCFVVVAALVALSGSPRSMQWQPAAPQVTWLRWLNCLDKISFLPGVPDLLFGVVEPCLLPL